MEPAHHETPEALRERRWALTLLEQALRRLQDEYRRSGMERVFQELKGILSGDKNDKR